MAYTFKRVIANDTQFDYEAYRADDFCIAHARKVMGIEPDDLTVEFHDHRPNTLCTPCMDHLDEDAEQLYEDHYELGKRWFATMPAGESLEHLTVVTMERLRAEGIVQ